MALYFDYASALAPTSSKHPAPTATRGSSYTAPLSLRFLYSFVVTQAIRQGLTDLLEDPAALNLRERSEAGRVLGGIRDERKGVGLNDQGLPDIDWKRIPPGEVVLEYDTGAFTVAPFYLAKYPITTAQFQCFIDDSEGYSNPRWWAELDEKPGTPKMPRWAESNHPRENVSWYEAMAFCAWLSERLGYTIHLPTEWQWQQAACNGQSDFNYPWGPEYQSGYANINETIDSTGSHYLQRTTAVGLYPQGNSLQGISDLSGNVCEWCLNTYDEPANTQVTGQFPRVVRGSSWLYKLENSRASFRGSDSPGGQYYDIGFRVCCVSPPEN